MRPTLRDVARAAGVSVSTTSRVFREPDRFRPATRERVLAAAAELGYRPNRAAQALITGRTGSVAVLVPNLTNPIFPELVRAAQHRLHAHGSFTLVADTDEDPAQEASLIAMLAPDVDAVITCSSLLDDDQIPDLAAQVRLVFVGRDPGPSHPSVLADDPAGMREVVALLTGLGHRRITYLAGRAASWAARRRLQAFTEAAAGAGVPVDVVDPNHPSFEGGRAAAEGLLRSGTLPTAVVAFNDLIALGLTARLAEAGVAVPGEVSVVGYDDVEFARMASPGLTTLAYPRTALGERAADLVGTAPADDPRRVFPLTLVERGSTGPARAG
ncbi:MAG: LacI family DNA-binding transcriptional regulator [Nocardioidaceae bacterium]|nr:LacI family DNA-binding transcriptional regulator [Nocardioidaceae bacterium]